MKKITLKTGGAFLISMLMLGTSTGLASTGARLANPDVFSADGEFCNGNTAAIIDSAKRAKVEITSAKIVAQPISDGTFQHEPSILEALPHGIGELSEDILKLYPTAFLMDWGMAYDEADFTGRPTDFFAGHLAQNYAGVIQGREDVYLHRYVREPHSEEFVATLPSAVIDRLPTRYIDTFPQEFLQNYLIDAAEQGQVNIDQIVEAPIGALWNLFTFQGFYRGWKSELFTFNEEDSPYAVAGGDGEVETVDVRENSSLGTGFIVGDSRILTNHHVIENTIAAERSEIKVTIYGGYVYDAVVVGWDNGEGGNDLAALMIVEEQQASFNRRMASGEIRAFEVRPGSEVEVGTPVFAIGQPSGLSDTVSFGRISALRGGPEGFIQTDAAVNRGNSGGPLVSCDGRLVGVNQSILSPSGGSIGLNFAVPGDVVTALTDNLFANAGEFYGTRLGVRLMTNPGGPDTLPQVVVEGVEDNPFYIANMMGLQAGDVIHSVNGVEVNGDVRALMRTLSIIAPGEIVELIIERDLGPGYGPERLTVRAADNPYI